MPLKLSKCRGCGKQIVWMKTKAGKAIPVDPVQNLMNESIFDPGRMIAHWATCSAAADFRQKKFNKKGE